MANDTETLADISAEMRDEAARADTDDYYTLNDAAESMREFAERIDAAAKREIPQHAGNAAAIRTALKRLRDASRNFYNQILNSQYSGILDKYTCAKQGFPAVLDVRAAIPAANAALSAAPAVECPPSNVAALREAMNVVHKIAATAKCDFDVFAGIERIRRISMSALSAPPRNCDVGTAKEQERRYDHFCHAHIYQDHCCADCPLASGKAQCEFAWSQMPYEAQEGGAA